MQQQDRTAAAVADPDPPPPPPDRAGAASSATQTLPSRNASSKYDFVKVKVWLGENADHYYVLSRFLLSRMLTVTKVHPIGLQLSITPFSSTSCCSFYRFRIMLPSRLPLNSRSYLSTTACLMCMSSYLFLTFPSDYGGVLQHPKVTLLLRNVLFFRLPFSFPFSTSCFHAL